MVSQLTPPFVSPGRVDGRIGYAPHGLNVGGEPCVWCGGGPGTPGDSRWALEGPGGPWRALEESGPVRVTYHEDTLW